MPVIEATETNIIMKPNIKYQWGVVPNLTINFAPGIPNVVNEYCGEFISGSTATNFAVPLAVSWVGGAPEIEANKRYEFSIVNGIGVMVGV